MLKQRNTSRNSDVELTIGDSALFLGLAEEKAHPEDTRFLARHGVKEGI